MDDSESGQPKTKIQLTDVLNKIILISIRILAVMMVFVILASLFDVGFIIYDKIIETKPMGVLNIEEIIGILGAFIGMLIAIEIYNNIIIYLKEESIHVKLVLATALIAVSRKVIILDYKTIDPSYIYATAAIVAATAVAYWIAAYQEKK